MRNPVKIFFVIFFLAASGNAQAEGIDWSKIRLGAGAYYQNSYGNLGKFWNESPGIGITGVYQFSESVYLEGAVYLSRFNVKPGHSFPDIWLIHMPLSLRIKAWDIGSSQLFISPGLANNTFEFNGEGTEILGDNNMESEFGLFIEAGLQTPISQVFNIEPFVKYQTIFASPVNINILHAGVKVFIR
jgi:hypothetical protein